MNKQYATIILFLSLLGNTCIYASPPQYDEETMQMIEFCRKQSLPGLMATNITGALSDLMQEQTPTQVGIDLLLQLLEDGTKEMSFQDRQQVSYTIMTSITLPTTTRQLKVKAKNIMNYARWLEENGQNPYDYLNKKEAKIAESYPLNEALTLFLLMQTQINS